MTANIAEIVGVFLVLLGSGLAVGAAALLSLIAALVVGAVLAMAFGLVLVITAARADAARRAAEVARKRREATA